MPLVQTRGAASAQGFGEFAQAAVAANYIEEVFSCFLYTGNGSTQTITNDIDLSTKGGLVWIKSRTDTSGGATSHALVDTVRGSSKWLSSNATSAEATNANLVTGFTTSGFSVGNTAYFANENAIPYASWTFREQPKFFDVVTYTGDGTTSNTISHNLGSTPGCIIIKPTQSASFDDWRVWHRSLTSQSYQLKLNTTDAQANVGNFISQDSTTFTIGYTAVNQSGIAYVAYLFAHDAGGFGLTGTDNVISCGSFTGSTSNVNVSLGYEPQWVMIKRTNSSDNWRLYDNMRGMTASNGGALLYADTSGAEQANNSRISVNATGFGFVDDGANTNIYIAIRRGPMKVPTVGTSVFAPLTYTGNGTSGRLISGAGFPPDLLIQTARSTSENREFDDRLRGGGSTAMNALFSNSTNAEAVDSGSVQLLNQDGFTVRSFGNGSGVTYIGECFRRAPSFFDEVCYTGNGTAGRTITHNLTVAPQLMIIKRRSAASFNGWPVYVPTSTAPRTNVCLLNTTASAADSSYFNLTAPTSTVFSVDDHQDVNASGNTYVAYLFATCAGVSKVGRYTGTGTTLQIDCGFTGGARWIMIKRTDSTGDWYVYDTARGMTVMTDPYLRLNSSAAETATLGSVITSTGGFTVNAAILAAVNTSGASYIFLAIA